MFSAKVFKPNLVSLAPHETVKLSKVILPMMTHKRYPNLYHTNQGIGLILAFVLIVDIILKFDFYFIYFKIFILLNDSLL